MSAAAQRDGLVRVCTLDDLPEVGAVLAVVDGRRIAIARDSAGDVHAIDDTCSHANVSLSEGEVEDGTIECWLHGSAFDLTTGQPTSLPATTPIAVHTVQIEGDVVYVALSDDAS
ncbi:non-heme iron oxygenase ferredoxin subunit [Ornithinimicrobium sediminis]|uniref:non-heme iron oxygenase ferredoxin subunit n=1 Tax=Ornithinimicrobium sediminis TaxID=2904603 RepID=UPI001E426B07|nr:non-heme iron oxygenase ferredoxin subunit [Ornithinimicrobium sediminis]